MKLKNMLLALFCLVTTIVTAQNSIKLLTTQKQFVAGSDITLKFKSDNNIKYQLYCTNSYGSTIINSEVNDSKLIFNLPDYLSNKIGVLNWKIINAENSISGQFQITPKSIPVSMETYLGPPSVEAGGTDFTMLVVIPTDDLDNPLKQNTGVTIKHQFLSAENKEIVFTNNLIAYQNIYSPLKSGRMILSSESLSLNSKEFDVNIMPAIGNNFKIFSKRNHEYADGNQITTFYTSIIKDKNYNTVSDGTYVDFFITNKKGNILKTSGITINGVANAKMIHPDYEENWTIKAYIVGIAESDDLKINYKKVIDQFNVEFSNNNRTITVGPLKSFMGQMIPDGLEVQLSIYKGSELLKNNIKKSKDGYVFFKLNPYLYNKGDYNFKVTTAGISETFQTKKIW